MQNSLQMSETLKKDREEYTNRIESLEREKEEEQAKAQLMHDEILKMKLKIEGMVFYQNIVLMSIIRYKFFILKDYTQFL